MTEPDDRPAFEAGRYSNKLLDNNEWMLGVPTPTRPLWEVMADAHFNARTAGMKTAYAEGCRFTPPLLSTRCGYAAELRAIADEIETRIYSDQPIEAVIELLRAEADRAEAGE